MNDSTQIQLEQPKGKGKLVLWLVILAVLLIGLLIWKSRSGGKAPETAAMPDTTTEAAPAAPPASASPETTVAEAPAKPIANRFIDPSQGFAIEKRARILRPRRAARNGYDRPAVLLRESQPARSSAPR